MHAFSHTPLLDIDLIRLYSPFYCYMCMWTYVYIWLTARRWDNQTVRVHCFTSNTCARRKAWGSPWPSKALPFHRGPISAKTPYDNQPDKARGEHTALRLQTCMPHTKSIRTTTSEWAQMSQTIISILWPQMTTKQYWWQLKPRPFWSWTHVSMHALGNLNLDPGKLSAIEQQSAQHPDPSKNIPDNFIACQRFYEAAESSAP
jgi:hypothetical protein